MNCRFHAMGRLSWFIGLIEATKVANAKLESATTEDERADAQAEIDRLQQQRDDAVENSSKWVF